MAFSNHLRLQISHTPTHTPEEEIISVDIVSKLHSFSQLLVKALTTPRTVYDFGKLYEM